MHWIDMQWLWGYQVVLNLEAGHHQPRNLDEPRQVSATVHRHGGDR